MKKLKPDYRHWLFGFLIFLLVFPFIQAQFKLIKEKPLKGAVTIAANVKPTIKGWFNTDYQVKKEEYLNDAFGFRSTFVRINNQIAFSLFKKANARGVIVGKEKYLFEESYIKAWYGQDLIETDTISRRMKQLKVIQDTLALRKKTLILVLAADKGSYFPEYFPAQYDTVKGPTNYETYVRYASENGINLIDFNRYFLENKTISRFPLYSKYGIHWTFYGSCLAADSILSFIEKARQIDMPDFKWSVIDLKKARGDDYDIGAGLNLIFKLKREKLAYPRIYFEPENGKTKPSVLVIADSYYWGMFNFGISNVFSTSHFWFYNQQVFPESFKNPLYTNQLDIMDEIGKHDVIILMSTGPNLPGLGWGFIQNTYNILFDKHLKQEVIGLAHYIRSDRKWMDHIIRKARDRNIPVDSMLMLDAEWGIRFNKKYEGFRKTVFWN